MIEIPEAEYYLTSFPLSTLQMYQKLRLPNMCVISSFKTPSFRFLLSMCVHFSSMCVFQFIQFLLIQRVSIHTSRIRPMRALIPLPIPRDHPPPLAVPVNYSLHAGAIRFISIPTSSHMMPFAVNILRTFQNCTK